MMETPMYIHFRFRNATIRCSTSEKKKTLAELKRLIKTDTISHPVTADQISGFLHVLCGAAPVPSKRNTVLKRIDSVQRLVDNAWIRYDRIPSRNEYEFMSSFKFEYNSHKKVSMNISDVGKKDGYYTWDYLKRGLMLKDPVFYKELMDMFCEVMGGDFYKMSMWEFIPEFHRHLTDDIVVRFENAHNDKIKSAFLSLIFNRKNTDTNIRYNLITPLVNSSGTGFMFSYSGDLVVRVDDEKMIEQIRNHGVVPKLLDGGVVSVDWTGFDEPFSSLDSDFERFSSKDCSLTY